MTSEQSEQLFIGLTPFKEWEAARKGLVHIERHHVPLRVYLTDRSIHAYVAAWRYTDDVMSGSTRITRVDGSGGHQYVIGESGALHIVENDSTLHASLQLGGQDEIISHERVTITYAPGSWQRATGPWLKDLPEKELNTRTYPGLETKGEGSGQPDDER